MSPDILQIIGLALLTLLVVAHLIWVVERRHHNSEFPNDYRRGIFTALWWAILTAVGYGEVTSRYGLGRLVTLMWIFFTLFAVSTFTAQLATTFTINQLQGSIQDITDLRGKTVGTWDSGKQYDYLRSHDIAMRTAEQTDELIQMLQNGDVDALLLDVGNALFVVEDEANHFVLAGSAVSPGSIAFPLIADSPYREQINRALLTLRENGTYEAIYERYFGSYQ